MHFPADLSPAGEGKCFGRSVDLSRIALQAIMINASSYDPLKEDSLADLKD
jgi:hypothetical protein